MTAGWETVRLGDVATIQSGSGFPVKMQGETSGPLPFVKVGDMNLAENTRGIEGARSWVSEGVRKELGAKVFPTGSVLFPKIGGAIATNKKRIVRQPCCADNNVMGVIPNRQIVDEGFLYNWLLAVDLSAFANEANPPSIRKTTVEAYPFPLPPLEEQKRIVAIIDAAFADIDQLSRNVVRKLATADELFESILEAALDGVTDGWPETTLAVEVNEGHCDLLAGFAFKSKEYSNVEGDVRLLRGDNIVPGSLRWDGVKRIAADRFEEFERYELREDDIVLAMDRPWVSAGLKLAVVAPNDLPALLVQRVARLRFGPTWDPLFAQYTLRQRRFSEHLLSAQTGVGVPHISASQIKKFSIWKPPVTVQREVGRRVRAAQEHCAQVRDRAVTARSDTADLRQSLLHRAFSGQL